VLVATVERPTHKARVTTIEASAHEQEHAGQDHEEQQYRNRSRHGFEQSRDAARS
jgi:hypothetical protein